MLYEPTTGSTFQNSSEFKAANPHTSYGDLVDEEDLNSVGLFTLVESRPPCNYSLFDCVPVGIVKNGDKYVQTYDVVPKPLTLEQVAEATLALFDVALTQHLDATAQARKYDNRITCMVRAGFPGPFQAEAVAFATWCDGCNLEAYNYMLDVQNGVIPMPQSPQELIDRLPVMVWPS